jgi:trans-2,3-dihydro-3-hydroxyanthranilate isomerase
MRFFITDVFAEKRYAGNRLGTFLGAASLPEAEMQAIARELHFPETTFVLSEAAEGGTWAVRIFTPSTEIDFGGHPTLGTAYVIREHVAPSRDSRVVLRLKVGDVPVSFTGTDGEPGVLWMRQVPRASAGAWSRSARRGHWACPARTSTSPGRSRRSRPG